jgi:hypothetical protein
MMITKGLVPVNDLLNSHRKGAWVMVKKNEGGIKVETPQAGPNSPTRGIENERIEETLIKTNQSSS